MRVDGGSGARNGGLGRGMGHGDGAWRRCRTVRGRSAGAGTGRRSRGRAAEREKTGARKIRNASCVPDLCLGGDAAVRVGR